MQLVLTAMFYLMPKDNLQLYTRTFAMLRLEMVHLSQHQSNVKISKYQFCFDRYLSDKLIII